MKAKIFSKDELEELIEKFVYSEHDHDTVNEKITVYVERYVHSDQDFSYFKSIIRHAMITAISATMRRLYETRRVTKKDIVENANLTKAELRKKRRDENEAIRIEKTIRQNAVAFKVLNELMMKNKCE